MRFAPIAAAFTLACLLLSGTANASAYPIRDSTLTANKLYKTGDLRKSKCHEPSVQRNDVASAKRYLTAILGCLNRSWGAHFKRAGLPFTPAKIGFITKPRKFCGSSWDDAAGVYCPSERRFLVLLDKVVLEDPTDLYLFNVAAHEFGHHVQGLTGISDANDEITYRNEKEFDEQSRREELQAECLGGAIIGGVWGSLDRTEEDWEFLLDLTRESDEEAASIRSHGTNKSIAAWLDRGFDAASPRACNTWTAPSSKVA
ncbi:hypothetical protein SAMN05444920_13447 [Nonomuraea solani]|uniref:Neutral zinc metallopeptidase n=1 Tax=Nonomuraea solani TaxID=1144553 RepID=A0A1H6F0Y7_9ACTN|nr:neutral zinc metallopeptidase [Nonomuraea solani]SEH03243.1 hypothetical protein SAMN05444920_13447 [Nonomuraea solani]